METELLPTLLACLGGPGGAGFSESRGGGAASLFSVPAPLQAVLGCLRLLPQTLVGLVIRVVVEWDGRSLLPWIGGAKAHRPRVWREVVGSTASSQLCPAPGPAPRCPCPGPRASLWLCS